MSQSLEEPQLVPSDHIYAVLQDFGPTEGGWGPAAWTYPGFGAPRPVIYSGRSTQAIAAFYEIAQQLHEKTGRPTKVCIYRQREDLATYE